MDSQHLSVCEQVVQRIELVPVALIGTQLELSSVMCGSISDSLCEY